MSVPIQLKMFDDADYPTVSAWWEGHGWSAVPRAILPKLGVVATRGDEQLAAAWLYMDNSCGVSIMEWIVTNPDAAPSATVRALKHITQFLTDEAKTCGYHTILTTCKQESLAKFHEKQGFTRSDDAMIHLVKHL